MGPDYNAIHDLHNYRRIHGEAFLYAEDNDGMPYLSASDIDEQSDSSNNGVELRIAGRKNSKHSHPEIPNPIHIHAKEEDNNINIIEEEELQIEVKREASLSLSMDENDIHLRTTT